MKLTDSRATVIAIIVLGLMQAACVNTKSTSKERSVVAPTWVGGVAREWKPLADDKLHDPANPGIKMLQEPGVALATLPANKPRMTVGTYRTVGMHVNLDGNKVDWMQALSVVSPRRARTPPGTGVESEALVMDMDMFLDMGGSMPIVRFPHLAHTMWLACSNCHPAIFVPQSGANPISMERILSGEQCGICHRAVSFPPTDCARCHSIGQSSPEGIKVRAEARAKKEGRANAMAEEAAAREKSRADEAAKAKAKAIAEAEAAARGKATTPQKAKKQTKNVSARP